LHKHLPEMKAATGIDFPPVFNPIVADFYSGMVVTTPIHKRFLKKQISTKDIWQMFKEYYGGHSMVEIMPFGEELKENFIASNSLSENNKIQIFIYGNEERFCITTRYDNLGKGASGAAVQCMNIMLGIEENYSIV